MKKPAKYEGSPADKAKDKREAAKRGMSRGQWEKSPADKRMDKAGQQKFSSRGR